MTLAAKRARFRRWHKKLDAAYLQVSLTGQAYNNALQAVTDAERNVDFAKERAAKARAEHAKLQAFVEDLAEGIVEGGNE